MYLYEIHPLYFATVLKNYFQNCPFDIIHLFNKLPDTNFQESIKIAGLLSDMKSKLKLQRSTIKQHNPNSNKNKK